MLIIDAFAFCQNGGQQTGKWRLPELTRLREECVSNEGELAWTLAGKQVNGYPALYLSIQGTVQLMCQRCLAPYTHEIKSDAKIVLAKNEQDADEIESSLEDDGIEVIAGSPAFDVVALVEDEAMLAIPLSPKHETCPKKEIFDADISNVEMLSGLAAAKEESPFATLKGQFVIDKMKS